MGWMFLLLAGLFEIGFTTAMRYLTWPPRIGPVLTFLVFSSASFGCLLIAMRSVPVGTAYAVWTGIGAIGTVILGIVLFAEPATALRLGCVALILTGIVGLKLVT